MAVATFSHSKRNNLATKSPDHKDWSSLPRDIVTCFTRQIVSLRDLYAFGGVCKSWRSEVIEAKSNNKALRLQHRVPIFFFPKAVETPFCDIYSLTQNKIYQLDLPETKDKRCYSSLGWLLTVHPDDHGPPKLELFNPLTHDRIKLPNVQRNMFIFRSLKKFVLSSSPSRTSDYEILLLSNYLLVFYKRGYNNGTWIQVQIPSRKIEKALVFMDAVYHKGRFYVLDIFGRIFICETEDSKDNQVWLKLVIPDIPSLLFLADGRNFNAHYLVEFAGTLLLVQSFFNDDFFTTDYLVRHVPIDTGKSWENSQVVKTLGNKTLFVGANNSSFWIEPLDDSVCQVNCIYFINRRKVCQVVGMDIGIYHMNDGKVDVPQGQSAYIKLLSHSWLQPSF